MCKTRDLIDEIEKTQAELNYSTIVANQELDGPTCYILMGLAFVTGLSLHKKVPNLPKFIATLAALPIFK